MQKFIKIKKYNLSNSYYILSKILHTISRKFEFDQIKFVVKQIENLRKIISLKIIFLTLETVVDFA